MSDMNNIERLLADLADYERASTATRLAVEGLKLPFLGRYINQPFRTLCYYEFTWTRNAAGNVTLVSIWD